MQNIPEGISLERKGDGIKVKGLTALPKDEALRVIEFIKQNKTNLLKGMAKRDIPRIEHMPDCVYDGKCKHLNGPGGCRPFCSKTGIPVFDLKGCPLNLWEGSPESGKEFPLAPRRRKIRFVNQSMVAAWRRGKQWCLEHLPELYAAGWDRHELLRAGRLKYPMGSWGSAWFWPEGDCTASLEPDGAICWTGKNANGKDVAQAMRPKNPIERKGHEKNEL